MDMETIMNFLADNYKWFMIAAGVLLLALIGFLVSGKKKKGNEEVPTPMPQNDFSQMGTLDQMQNAQAQPEQMAAQPAVEPQAPVQSGPATDTIFTGEPVNNESEAEQLVIEAPSGALNNNTNMDTMGMDMPGVPVTEATPEVAPVAPAPEVAQAPVAPMPEVAPAVAAAPVEELVIEPAPAPAEPAAPAVPVMETPAVEPMAAVPETPVMEAPETPVMSAPVEEMPISMTPEEPAPMPAPVAPMPEAAPVAPAAPAVDLQNTIQQ